LIAQEKSAKERAPIAISLPNVRAAPQLALSHEGSIEHARRDVPKICSLHKRLKEWEGLEDFFFLPAVMSPSPFWDGGAASLLSSVSSRRIGL
jgi:hypothetical protein